MGPVQMALADAGLKPADIDEVVLVGGSTRVPLVRRMVEQFFGRRRTRNSIPMKWSRWARPFRPTFWKAA